MPTYERIARNIKGFAALRDVSMQSVFEAAGLSKQQFNKRLNGKPKWRIEELEKVAGYLDVTVKLLLGDPSALLARESGWSTADDLVAA